MHFLTREGYRRYLEHIKLAQNTINSYCSGLQHISMHYGADVFSLIDLDLLELLMGKYGKNGEFSDIGGYGNAAAYNALKHWMNYVKAGNDITCILLASPEEQLETGQKLPLPDSLSYLNSDTTVYLFRLRTHPKGIIARGVVKTAGAPCIEVHEVRNDCATGLVPMVLINQLWFAKRTYRKIYQGEMPEKHLAVDIDKRWNDSRDVHSLRQYIEWNRNDSFQMNRKWYEGYAEHTGKMAELRKNQGTLSDEDLDWIWLQSDNGICTIKRGALPKAEYEKNRDFLLSLTQQIIASPDATTRQNVFSQWDEKIKTGEFTTRRYAVVNRVFAAVSPEKFTTLVNKADCKALMDGIAQHFELTGSRDGDWIDLNNSLKNFLSVAGIDTTAVLENNIALWQLSLAMGALNEDMSTMNDAQIPTHTETSRLSGYNSGSLLNKVLYGPPGTGKTFATIDHALAILAPELFEAETDRESLKAAFDSFVRQGQIIFTTFHQSYSYEDFVEGIRAEATDMGQLEYRVEPGVFKKLCEQARTGITVDEDPFEKALMKLRNKLEANGDELTGFLTKQNKRFSLRQSERGSFRAYPEDSTKESGRSVQVKKLKSRYQAAPDQQVGTYSYGILKYMEEHCGLPLAYSETAIPRKKFVIIIDEINRGNISRIFGELITLIEPGKRSGASEALSVMLPYSKETFSIPENVYLIGTMNTADRSLATMDIALRRRFVFHELMPEPRLLENVVVEGINIGHLLTVMNDRIEVLLDRDHLLGHAYFMPLVENRTLAKLSQIFRTQIIPLLQEYFFEDWKRVQWVLNDHRKETQYQFVAESEVDASTLFGNIDLNQKTRWTINELAFGMVESYSGIIDATSDLA